MSLVGLLRGKKCVICTFCGLRSQTSSGTSTMEVTVLSLHDSSPAVRCVVDTAVYCSAGQLSNSQSSIANNNPIQFPAVHYSSRDSAHRPQSCSPPHRLSGAASDRRCPPVAGRTRSQCTWWCKKRSKPSGTPGQEGGESTELLEPA